MVAGHKSPGSWTSGAVAGGGGDGSGLGFFRLFGHSASLKPFGLSKWAGSFVCDGSPLASSATRLGIFVVSFIKPPLPPRAASLATLPRPLAGIALAGRF
jgi:hypothetical protein